MLDRINPQEILKRFIGTHGWTGLVSIFFYPVIVLVMTPIRLIQALWNSRILLSGKRWGDYPHFSIHSALNSLCYHTRAVNLYRYGRSGVSPVLGLGNYRLTRGFNYSFTSLYAYWKAGAVILLMGMFGWWMGHFVWLDEMTDNWFLFAVILLISLINTTLYANVFELQNYNILGWVFFPIGLYGWFTNHWGISSIAWLGASFGSFTVVIIAITLSIVYCFEIVSFWPFISTLPAAISIASHLWPNLQHRGVLNTFGSVLKAIGLVRKNAKYVRTTMMRLSLRRIYFLIIYLQFILVHAMFHNHIPVLFIACLFIWFVNSLLARFADEQTLQMLMLTASTATMMQLNRVDLLSLASYWILASPIPLLLGFNQQKCLNVVPICRPFNISPLLQKMNNFLSSVKKGQTILMAFDDPQGVYESIFDGYRYLLEVPLFIASQKHIHLMPDWWGVFDLNYEGAPDFWGRDLESVMKNTRLWKADFIIIYQEAGSELEAQWEYEGYKIMDKFSWTDMESTLNGMKPYHGQTPDWWLLKVPDSLKSR